MASGLVFVLAGEELESSIGADSLMLDIAERRELLLVGAGLLVILAMAALALEMPAEGENRSGCRRTRSDIRRKSLD
jgi:hypothetical protein